MIRRLRALEWVGCSLGLLGAFLLATNTSVSRYGWIAFLLANFAVIGFAKGIRAHGLLVQQMASWRPPAWDSSGPFGRTDRNERRHDH